MVVEGQQEQRQETEGGGDEGSFGIGTSPLRLVALQEADGTGTQLAHVYHFWGYALARVPGGGTGGGATLVAGPRWVESGPRLRPCRLKVCSSLSQSVGGRT